MRTKTEQWLRALAAAIITGASNNALGVLGISAANVVGLHIPQLDLKQMGTLMLSGGCVGMLAYLKQSPVPPASTGDTMPPFPKPDGSNVNPNQNEPNKTP